MRNVGVDSSNLDDAKQNGVAVTNVRHIRQAPLPNFRCSFCSFLRNQNLFRKRMAKQDYRWAPFIGKLGKMTVGVMRNRPNRSCGNSNLRDSLARLIAYDRSEEGIVEKTVGSRRDHAGGRCCYHFITDISANVAAHPSLIRQERLH